MTAVIAGRQTALRSEPFVVFVIGMRINKPWKIWQWGRVAAAMPRMLKELYQNPGLGFLGGQMWFSRTFVMIQYWRSVDALNAYAKSREAQHLPAWTAFNTSVGNSGDVGIFHETYRIEPGDFECVYVNMPRFGIGAIEPLQPAAGALAGAAGRMKARAAAAAIRQ
jgi:hypothetical protein